MMEIRCRTQGRATVLELVGELCVVTAPVVAAAIDTAVDSGGRDVVLDVAEVTLFGSTAANLVIDAAARVSAVGGTLSIRNAAGLTAFVVDLAGLTPLLEGPTLSVAS